MNVVRTDKDFKNTNEKIRNKKFRLISSLSSDAHRPAAVEHANAVHHSVAMAAAAATQTGFFIFIFSPSLFF